MSGSKTLLVHPIFDECKNFTLDPFWKEQFSNFAINKFPQGMRYDHIHHNIILKLEGKRSEIIALPDGNPTETFILMMTILKTKLGMQSSRDIKIKKEELDDLLQKKIVDMDCEWKKIKPRHLKEQLITDFSVSLKERYNLTNTELRQLVSLIQIGFQFKALSSNDVNYENGAVQSIKGLTFDQKNRKFSIPHFPTIHAVKGEKTSSANKFCSAVNKYIKNNNLRASKYVL